MSRKGLWWAAAIVLIANLGAWGAAAQNRRGEPEAVLVLTENELRLPARQVENTSLTLSLVFDRPRGRGGDTIQSPGWFDRAKLASIGFDCRRPVTEQNAAYYRTRPPRVTYAALQYDEAATAGSRLRPVDVDNDARVLRQRHPDRRRVAVVEATASMLYVSHPGEEAFLTGVVMEVLPAELNVPRQWRSLLEGLQPGAPADVRQPLGREPRFRATVAWGRRLEPWITNVEMLNPTGGQ